MTPGGILARQPTANEVKERCDGALIMLTTALGADRTGQIYDGPLLPDQKIKIDWTQIEISR